MSRIITNHSMNITPLCFRLFGVIARVYQNYEEKHICYVFEAEGMYSGKIVREN